MSSNFQTTSSHNLKTESNEDEYLTLSNKQLNSEPISEN